MTAKVTDDVARSLSQATNSIASHTIRTAESLEELLQRTTRDISEALVEIKDRLASLELPPAELGKQLKKRLDRFVEISAAASDSASSLQQVMSSLGAELKGTSASAALATSELSSLGKTVQGASSDVKGIGEALATIKRLLGTLDQEFTSTAESAQALGIRSKNLATELEDIHKFAATFSIAMAELTRLATSATPSLGQLSSALSTMDGRLAGLIAAIGKAEDLGKSIQLAQQGATAEFSRGVELLKNHQMHVEELSQRLVHDLAASETALRKVHANLVDATNFVVSKVQ